MKLTKFDIGAEIISILTRGMYPDPRDAVREYIQNAVDAKAPDVSVKIRIDSVVVDDNGVGMNQATLRKAIRVGISDKNPAKSVGFMGIGIYSAFHLCNRLEIYSRGSENIPNRLTMDFGGMKALLKEQKDLRLNGQIESDQLTDLQTLLENYITVTENGDLKSAEFPERGTRVELTGIEPEFFSMLSNFDEMSAYLREVIPLHFDKSNFTPWAEEIESSINQICQQHQAHFELVNLTLQVGGQMEKLYRPYKNTDFNNKNVPPQKPFILEVKHHNDFFGVAWGCLNGIRHKVNTTSLRGFIIKKQGFSIGKRENLLKYFPRGHTFFDRYIGEIIVTDTRLLPNAARNDFEFSEWRTRFYEALTKVADKYDEAADDFQEWTKADEDLAKYNDELKRLNATLNLNAENAETVVNLFVQVKALYDKINGRIKRKALRPGTEDEAKSIRKQCEELEKLMQAKITAIAEQKKMTQKQRDKPMQIAQTLSDLDLPKPVTKNYESLVELLEDLEIPFDEAMREVLNILDEKFIEGMASNRQDYYKLLDETKDKVNQLLENTL